MKKFYISIFLAFSIGLSSYAQTPTTVTYRLAQVSGLDYAMVIEYLGHADYTNLTLNRSTASVMVLATDGSSVASLTNKQGTWSQDNTFDHTAITPVCSDNSTTQYDGFYFSATGDAVLGNRTSTTTTYIDTLFVITMSNTVAGGVIKASGGSLSSTTPDNCIGGVFDNTATFDRDGLGGSSSYGGDDIEGVGIPAPLPVDLIDFEVLALENHDAQLTWATTSEFQNSHFDIQRSFDGYRFTTIGQVAGNGTSHALIQYTYVDETIPAHENKAFYRLHQVDFDVKSENSDVRLVQFNSSRMETITAYPNPTHDETTLLLSNEVNQGTYTITDLVGKQWAADIIKAGSRSVKMDFSHLPAGAYMATLQTDGIQKHVRIVKY